MTRSSAREIAIHCSYSLGFSHESADEFLAVRLNKENFQRWSQESALYKEYPNEKQLQYIKELVRGVANHGPELDQYIAQYAKDWSFARIPLPAAAIMRVAVEIAKKYEDGKVVSFINGILGAFVRAEFPEQFQDKKLARAEVEPATEHEEEA